MHRESSFYGAPVCGVSFNVSFFFLFHLYGTGELGFGAPVRGSQDFGRISRLPRPLTLFHTALVVGADI